jgi:two-component system KDP operon response regulator KdpE
MEHTTHILVVDDDPDIRQLVVELLRLSSYVSSSASSGVLALRELADPFAERPDVVLLDVQMPELDGWDTLRAIRARTDLDEVRVVLCTVKAAPDDVQLAWSLGCDGYLAKPFAVADLVAEIERVRALPARETTSTTARCPQ